MPGPADWTKADSSLSNTPRTAPQAEEFAEQDKKVKAKIDARNQLETYIYNMKSTVEDKMKVREGTAAVTPGPACIVQEC